jgi:methyl coenzyme M reductase subunit D
MTTSLNSLSYEEENDDITEFKSPKEIILSDLSLNIRLKTIEDIYTNNNDSCIELILQLCNMFLYTCSSNISELLVAICQSEIISVDTKLLIACNIKDISLNTYLDCIVSFLFTGNFDILIKIDFCEFLINNNVKVEECSNLLGSYFTDKNDPNVKYKVLKFLKLPNNIHSKLYFTFFTYNTDEHYNILCSQYLLKNNYETENVKEHLKQLISNKDVEYNIKAEALDLLTLEGNDEEKEYAKKTLHSMGKEGKLDTLFNNKENVHNDYLFKSAMTMLKRIEKEKPTKTFEDVQKRLKSLTTNNSVFNSLERIKNDNSIYSKSSLEEILCKVYTIICDMEEKETRETYIDRLIEELIEMDKTCTSGHFIRLINTLSGYKDFTLVIDIKDQIISNIAGRLRKLILEDKDNEELLCGMSKPSLDNLKFNKFFANNIQHIYHDMKPEFTNMMSEEDFDNYFRIGMIRFTGEEGDVEEMEEYCEYDGDV